jgi:hypothetical protein
MSEYQDDSWLKGEALGYTIAKKRSGGTFYKISDHDGLPYYWTYVFVPNPLAISPEEIEIIDAWSNKDTSEGPWNDFVVVRDGPDLGQKLMGPKELAGYRGKAHWKFSKQSPEDRKAQMDRDFAIFKSLNFAAKTL